MAEAAKGQGQPVGIGGMRQGVEIQSNRDDRDRQQGHDLDRESRPHEFYEHPDRDKHRGDSVVGWSLYHARNSQCRSLTMVPLAGLEPALPKKLDFESSASTNSATGALLIPRD